MSFGWRAFMIGSALALMTGTGHVSEYQLASRWYTNENSRVVRLEAKQPPTVFYQPPNHRFVLRLQNAFTTH